MDKLERHVKKDLYEDWDSAEKRRRQQPSADRNGVGVWPNASAWTWAEARSRSRCFHSVAMKYHSVALWRFCALGTVYLRSVYYLLTYLYCAAILYVD